MSSKKYIENIVKYNYKFLFTTYSVYKSTGVYVFTYKSNVYEKIIKYKEEKLCTNLLILSLRVSLVISL